MRALVLVVLVAGCARSVPEPAESARGGRCDAAVAEAASRGHAASTGCANDTDCRCVDARAYPLACFLAVRTDAGFELESFGLRDACGVMKRGCPGECRAECVAGSCVARLRRELSGDPFR